MRMTRMSVEDDYEDNNTRMTRMTTPRMDARCTRDRE
jgi:hypothetical protein